MKILYFTGTGNSLYVAKKIGGELISIPQAMKDKVFEYEDEKIGIVCPTYCLRPPKMVIEFMKNVQLKSPYIFMIYTFGTRYCDAPEWTTEFVKNKNYKIDYINGIRMVDNYLPMFDMNEEIKIDKNIESQIEQIIQDIHINKKEIPVPSNWDREHTKELEKMNMEKPEFNNGSQITITDACIKCGICTKVCPVGNIKIEEHSEKATRKSKECEFCLACANNCPVKAIKLNIMDKNPEARFRNEHIDVQEIIKSNCVI